MNLLIDGHNLIFACGLYGKHANSESLARARLRLLQDLENHYPANRLAEIAVVFDAKRIPLSGQKERDNHGPIHVYYSINYENADALIEELINRHSAPKMLTVISSDRRVQHEAKSHGAGFHESEQWYFDILLTNKLKHAKESPNKQSDSASEKDGLHGNPFPQDYLEDTIEDFDLD